MGKSDDVNLVQINLELDKKFPLLFPIYHYLILQEPMKLEDIIIIYV